MSSARTLCGCLVAAVVIAGSISRAAHADPQQPGIACEQAGELPVCIAAQNFDHDVCVAIDRFARRQSLPPGFFARLIWQESRFDPNAVSPKGARGIAQFMPPTADLRGLSDSFNPADALAKSAAYLHKLRNQFGNLGLAAAGYNAGEARAADLVALGRPLPAETDRYVLDVTGLPITAWTDSRTKSLDFRLDDKKPFLRACIDLASERITPPARTTTSNPDPKPWGAELGASFSMTEARRIFDQARSRFPNILGGATPLFIRQRNLSFGTRARYTVRVGRDSREGAETLCRSITAAGGYCIVQKN